MPILSIGVLLQPVLIDGPNDVLVKINETAHFECLFKSSQDNFTVCEWHKENDVLNVSEKYQFSPVPQSDPVNVGIVLCSLDVLNVSMDDVGIYSCLVYYNKTLPMKNRIWSNSRQAELDLAGTYSQFILVH